MDRKNTYLEDYMRKRNKEQKADKKRNEMIAAGLDPDFTVAEEEEMKLDRTDILALIIAVFQTLAPYFFMSIAAIVLVTVLVMAFIR